MKSKNKSKNKKTLKKTNELKEIQTIHKTSQQNQQNQQNQQTIQNKWENSIKNENLLEINNLLKIVKNHKFHNNFILNPSTTTTQNFTVLDIAVFHNNFELVKNLLDYFNYKDLKLTTTTSISEYSSDELNKQTQLTIFEYLFDHFNIR